MHVLTPPLALPPIPSSLDESPLAQQRSRRGVPSPTATLATEGARALRL